MIGIGMPISHIRMPLPIENSSRGCWHNNCLTWNFVPLAKLLLRLDRSRFVGELDAYRICKLPLVSFFGERTTYSIRHVLTRLRQTPQSSKHCSTLHRHATQFTAPGCSGPDTGSSQWLPVARSRISYAFEAPGSFSGEHLRSD